MLSICHNAVFSGSISGHNLVEVNVGLHQNLQPHSLFKVEMGLVKSCMQAMHLGGNMEHGPVTFLS